MGPLRIRNRQLESWLGLSDQRPCQSRPDARTLHSPRGNLKEADGIVRNSADMIAAAVIWSAAILSAGIFLTLIVLGHS